MNTTTNLTERVLEFSRYYFTEPEARGRLAPETWSTSGDTWPAGQTQAQRTPTGDGGRVAAWQGLYARGIPELASPLPG
jgi:hypothetical protein